MTFASPYLLPVLLVVPVAAFVAWWLGRRRARYAVAFTNMDVLATVVVRRRRYRTLGPLALFRLALASAGAAVARPEGTVHVAADRATWPPWIQTFDSAVRCWRSVTTTKSHGCQFMEEGARRPASRIRFRSSPEIERA